MREVFLLVAWPNGLLFLDGMSGVRKTEYGVRNTFMLLSSRPNPGLKISSDRDKTLISFSLKQLAKFPNNNN